MWCVVGHTEAAAAQIVTDIAPVLTGLLTGVGTHTAAAEIGIAAGPRTDDSRTQSCVGYSFVLPVLSQSNYVSDFCWFINLTVYHQSSRVTLQV